jgi:hypothetical protein
VFTEHLSRYVKGHTTSDEPLLHTADTTAGTTTPTTLNTVLDIVHAGEHLDHFHTYKPSDTATSTAKAIEFHTDQGLFIAFAAPAMVEQNGAPGSTAAGNFMVDIGGLQMVATLRDDALHFMLGDGVQQYINPRLGAAALRPTPHALIMPRAAKGESRSWYGRMFLPPAEAISEEHGLTYGKVRSLIRSEADDKVLSMGCSGQHLARELLESDCNATTHMYCWARCMPYTPEASPETCEQFGLNVQCLSEFGSLAPSTGKHGSYWPTCGNTTTVETPAPTIAPAVATCSLEDVAAELAGKYSHVKALVDDKTHLYWNIVGKEVELAYLNLGRMGWVSIGPRNVGGKHKGMNGAHVVMATVNPPEEETPAWVREYVPLHSITQHGDSIT